MVLNMDTYILFGVIAILLVTLVEIIRKRKRDNESRILQAQAAKRMIEEINALERKAQEVVMYDLQ